MTKQIKVGMALQYIQIIANILVKLLFTSICLKILGQTEYGIYSLVGSIISYLSLLSLGFGSGYVRFYTRYKVNNDEDGIKKLNGLYLLVFSIMGFVVLIAGIILTINSNIFFNNTYSTENLKTAKILMGLLTINMAWSFPLSIFNSYITSQEKFIFQKLLNIIKTILSPALCIIALLLGQGSIGIVIITTLVAMAIDIVTMYYCLKKLNMKFCFKGLQKKVFKEILVFSIFIAINQIIDQINTQTDKLILGKMLTASAVSIYTVGATVQNLYQTLSVSTSSFFAPKVNQIVAQKSPNMNEKLTDLFINIGKMQFVILMLVNTGFIVFGKYFIQKWAGADYWQSYWIAIILIVSSTVPLIQNIGIEVQRAKNKHQFRSIVYLIIAIMNLILSIVLCKFIGIWGVTIGTLISNIIGTVIIINIYYHKKIGLNLIRFWKEIFRTSLGLLIPICLGIILYVYIDFNNIWLYLALIIVYSLVYCLSIYFIGLKCEEKKVVNCEIKKIKNYLLTGIKKIMKKIKKMLKTIYQIFVSIRYYVLSRLFCKKRVVFISFDGKQYSDNPKAISRYLHQIAPNIKQIWLFNNPLDKKNCIPNYIKAKKLTRWNVVHYLATSRVVVDNDFLVYPWYLLKVKKSKKQLFIQTWHGDKGFKKCFYDTKDFTRDYRFNTETGLFDYIVTGCSFVEPIMKSMFNYHGQLLKTGNARNDCLFEENADKINQIKKKLNIPQNDKVLTYAPTFRENIKENYETINLEKAIEELNKLTGNSWHLIVRAHHRSKNNLKINFIDGNTNFEDMADLLMITDMLITDYSSCAGDFAQTNKPVILYIEDYADYENKDRGLYFKLNESPFILAQNNTELINIINNINWQTTSINSKAILDFYGNYEKGNASKLICDLIIDNLRK